MREIVGEDQPVQSSGTDPQPATDIDHPVWCDHKSSCRPHSIPEYVEHRSEPRRVAVRAVMLEISLAQVEHSRARGRKPSVSIREVPRRDEDGMPPASEDQHLILTIYAARLLHRELGDLLADYDTSVGKLPQEEVDARRQLRAVRDAWDGLWDALPASQRRAVPDEVFDAMLVALYGPDEEEEDLDEDELIGWSAPLAEPVAAGQS